MSQVQDERQSIKRIYNYLNQCPTAHQHGRKLSYCETYQIPKNLWDFSVILEKSLLLLTYNSRVFGSVNGSRNSEGFFPPHNVLPRTRERDKMNAPKPVFMTKFMLNHLIKITVSTWIVAPRKRYWLQLRLLQILLTQNGVSHSGHSTTYVARSKVKLIWA